MKNGDSTPNPESINLLADLYSENTREGWCFSE